MTARCAVRRPGGTTTDEDGYEVTAWDDAYADLPCWVDRQGGTRTVSVGGVEMQLATRILKVPYYATAIRDGDLVDVLTGACAGLAFRVVESVTADQKKQQELPIVEVPRPEEWA
jgi:hypothetical protein